ncbi:uncharacterized protein LOC141749491 [Larus michahellis]|uniref:uncharacterized protein LOC141749491 n=1 Tax=Larus michahellis TaxID=119627 RepID=UPI003D9BA940
MLLRGDASTVFQKFTAASYRNGLKIKFNRAGNHPGAATASSSETERRVNPVVFLAQHWRCSRANRCTVTELRDRDAFGPPPSLPLQIWVSPLCQKQFPPPANSQGLANSPPSLRAHAGSPRVLVSLRCVSASSAAWHRGVLSVPGEGRVRQRSRPWWYFASQGMKELNFSDGKRTEDQTSSLVTSRCRASSSSPARARQLHPSLGGAVAGAADPDHVWPRPSQQQIGLPKPSATRLSHLSA